jgi:hypothetical protein
VAELQGASLSSHGTKADYKGTHFNLNLNVNLPPPCTTGYLPAQQRRSPALQDEPDLPHGSGLGLSLVRAIVRLHRGEVELQDNHPGLRVVCSFPRSQ